MESYKIEITTSAIKSLKNIPKKDLLKITNLIQTLAIDPFPEGVRKLSGEIETYRVRQGNYRVIYEVYEKKLIVLVLKIGHRKDIYKK